MKNSPFAWEMRRLKRAFRGESPQRAAEYRFYHGVIPHGDGCIVDVGASIGSKTEIFRTLARCVVAIEPDPVAAALLRKRFRWRRGVIIRECAITVHTGVAAFYQFGPASSFNTVDRDWVEAMMHGSNHMHIELPQPHKITVPAYTLAEIVSEFGPVKYLKVDAEGHEARVMSTLNTVVPLVSLEFNLPEMADSLTECVQRLAGLGPYVFNAAISEPPAHFEFEWLTATEILTELAARRWRYAEVYAMCNYS